MHRWSIFLYSKCLITPRIQPKSYGHNLILISHLSDNPQEFQDFFSISCQNRILHPYCRYLHRKNFTLKDSFLCHFQYTKPIQVSLHQLSSLFQQLPYFQYSHRFKLHQCYLSSCKVDARKRQRNRKDFKQELLLPVYCSGLRHTTFSYFSNHILYNNLILCHFYSYWESCIVLM